MSLTRKNLDSLSHKIIGCAIEVHKHQAQGLLESVYGKYFTHELGLRGVKYQSQQRVPVSCKGLSLEAELRYDVLVENLIIVEIKSINSILPIHEAVMLIYLKMINKPKGIIINFNSTKNFLHTTEDYCKRTLYSIARRINDNAIELKLREHYDTMWLCGKRILFKTIKSISLCRTSALTKNA